MRQLNMAATYKVVFKPEWEKNFPIQAVPSDKYKFYCIPCGENVSCHHQGLGDVKAHCERDTHNKNLGQLNKQKALSFS